MLSVPHRFARTEVIGVMNVANKPTCTSFCATEVEFVQTLAAQVAGIIELSALRLKLAAADARTRSRSSA